MIEPAGQVTNAVLVDSITKLLAATFGVVVLYEVIDRYGGCNDG